MKFLYFLKSIPLELQKAILAINVAGENKKKPLYSFRLTILFRVNSNIFSLKILIFLTKVSEFSASI